MIFKISNDIKTAERTNKSTNEVTHMINSYKQTAISEVVIVVKSILIPIY